MKKKLIPMALMALAMGFTACSSDDTTANGSNGKPSYAEGGYVKMAINLPSTSGTRAANDNFDDGLAAEYQVKNATLVLFSGNDEASAKFHSAYALNVSMNKDSEAQITSTTKIVSKIEDGATSASKLYAYVVLNDNGLLTLDADDATKLSVNSEDMADQTIAKLQELVVEGGASKFTTAGFLMDNAPLASIGGGTANPSAAEVTTLVDFTNSVKSTQAEAEASPATEVNVERAVAKVTFDKGNGGTLSGTDVNLNGYAEGQTKSYEIVGWDLDITNNKSFFARNYDTDWNGLKTGSATVTAPYRFIGSAPIRNGQSLFRTYWATDPNYAHIAPTTTEFTYLAANKTDFTEKFGTDNPQYCMENTFDVAGQNQNQTTRAIVKVKLFGGSDFYTFNNDKSQLYTHAEMVKRVKAAIIAKPEVVAWYKGLTTTQELNEDKIDVSLDARNASTGAVNIISYKVTIDAEHYDGTIPTGADADYLNKDLGVQTITCYQGGVAYYPIRIKHFGDDLTPWNKDESATDLPSAGNIYPSNSAANYLGRYGVVRNNWYDLSVAGISGIGSATVPSLDPSTNPDPVTPDDELYNYIAVRINILSWAKRTQSENL